jgi:hypothetical protein
MMYTGSGETQLFVFSAMSLANAVVASRAPMTLSETLILSVIISLLGGVAAAIRQTKDLFVLLQFSMNTAVLGVSGVMVSHMAIGESYSAQLAAIGIAGILSLGGLSTIDWVRSLLQRGIESRIKKQEEDSDNGKR